MTTARSDHSARIMAAALSRRRVLKGLTGAATLVLAHRRADGAHAATTTPGVGFYPGLPRAALVPSDLPGGEGFGVASGSSFLGLSGGTASRILDETLLAALGDTAETLVGGHITILQPLGNQVNRTISTRLFQFRTVDDADDARDRFAAGAFSRLQEITPDDARGRFFAGTLDQGSATFAQEVVLFRAADVVAIILISDRTGPAAPEPLPGEPAERLEALRRAVALRLRDVADPELAGLRRTIPSVAEVVAASAGQLDLAIDWWLESYSQLDGKPIRSRYQSDEDVRTFQDTHPGLVEAVRLVNNLVTFGGNPLALMVEGYRFNGIAQTSATNLKAPLALRTIDPNAAAQAYFDAIPERLQAVAAANPNLDVQPVEPPAGAPESPPTKWFVHRSTTETSQSLETWTWLLNGPDVVGVGIAGPPSTGESAPPDYQGTLLGFAVLAAEIYLIWLALEFVEFLLEAAEAIQQLCEDLDRAIAEGESEEEIDEVVV